MRDLSECSNHVLFHLFQVAFYSGNFDGELQFRDWAERVQNDGQARPPLACVLQFFLNADPQCPEPYWRRPDVVASVVEFCREHLGRNLRDFDDTLETADEERRDSHIAMSEDIEIGWWLLSTAASSWRTSNLVDATAQIAELMCQRTLATRHWIERWWLCFGLSRVWDSPALRPAISDAVGRDHFLQDPRGGHSDALADLAALRNLYFASKYYHPSDIKFDRRAAMQEKTYRSLVGVSPDGTLHPFEPEDLEGTSRATVTRLRSHLRPFGFTVSHHRYRVVPFHFGVDKLSDERAQLILVGDIRNVVDPNVGELTTHAFGSLTKATQNALAFGVGLGTHVGTRATKAMFGDTLFLARRRFSYEPLQHEVRTDRPGLTHLIATFAGFAGGFNYVVSFDGEDLTLAEALRLLRTRMEAERVELQVFGWAGAVELADADVQQNKLTVSRQNRNGTLKKTAKLTFAKGDKRSLADRTAVLVGVGIDQLRLESRFVPDLKMAFASLQRRAQADEEATFIMHNHCVIAEANLLYGKPLPIDPDWERPPKSRVLTVPSCGDFLARAARLEPQALFHVNDRTRYRRGYLFVSFLEVQPQAA